LFIREDQAFVAFSYGKMQETGSYKPGSSATAQDFAVQWLSSLIHGRCSRVMRPASFAAVGRFC